MKIYHGTSQRNGEKILKKGKVQVASASNSHYEGYTGTDRTTYGYVYLTPSEEVAYNFGLRSIKPKDVDINAHKKTVFIYEIDIDVEKLEVCLDECESQMVSRCETFNCFPCDASNCIKTVNAACHAGDLYLGKQVMRYKVVSQSLIDRRTLKRSVEQDWIELSSGNNYMSYIRSKLKRQFWRCVNFVRHNRMKNEIQ